MYRWAREARRVRQRGSRSGAGEHAADGHIGEVQFVETSSGMNLAYQGTHSLQAVGAFLPGAVPVSVFGQVGGAEGLAETPSIRSGSSKRWSR
ncbi:MAG: hypothetical protein ACLFNT_14145 [Spirochaetales bacterium]